jgi:hypothetical protein
MWLKPKFNVDALTPASCLALGEPRRISLGLEKCEKQYGLFHRNALDSPKSHKNSNPCVR